MSESIEEIVARIERGITTYETAFVLLPGDLRVLIASWRERGEALKDGMAAINAAINMARAEEQGHDRTAEHCCKIIESFRARAGAALGTSEEEGA